MINASTTLCCVIGNPIKHSFSPQIHNLGYEKLGLNFCFLAFEVEDLKKAIDGIRAFNIRGTSVTIPHKIKIMEYLDKVDKRALKIGAVNTVVNKQGVLTGYNTDGEGALTAIKKITTLKNKKVALLGAGGAARAIATILEEELANIWLFARDKKKANAFAKDFKIEKILPLANISAVSGADIIINATPTGMHPNINITLVPAKLLHKKQIVFDIVYNPKETRLIKDAKKTGCRVVYGYEMLLYQAVAQFKLYTGIEAPVSQMRQELVNVLTH